MRTKNLTRAYKASIPPGYLTGGGRIFLIVTLFETDFLAVNGFFIRYLL